MSNCALLLDFVLHPEAWITRPIVVLDLLKTMSVTHNVPSEIQPITIKLVCPIIGCDR